MACFGSSFTFYLLAANDLSVVLLCLVLFLSFFVVLSVFLCLSVSIWIDLAGLVLAGKKRIRNEFASSKMFSAENKATKTGRERHRWSSMNAIEGSKAAITETYPESSFFPAKQHLAIFSKQHQSCDFKLLLLFGCNGDRHCGCKTQLLLQEVSFGTPCLSIGSCSANRYNSFNCDQWNGTILKASRAALVKLLVGFHHGDD